MAGATKKVFGAYVHVTKKDGTSEAFAPGEAVPSWASKLVGDHVLAQPDAEKPDEQELATPAKPASTDGGTPDDEQAKAIEALQAQLAAIGQPTDGTLEELQKRLDEHGE